MYHLALLLEGKMKRSKIYARKWDFNMFNKIKDDNMCKELFRAERTSSLKRSVENCMYQTIVLNSDKIVIKDDYPF